MATSSSCTSSVSLASAVDTGDLKVFLGAVQDILIDEGFKLPTPQASNALETASALLEWSSSTENKAKLSQFSRKLTHYLQQCLPASTPTAGDDREKIWRKFHTFRTSKDYFDMWDKFLKDSINKGGPIFFQHVTSQVFNELVKKRFPIPVVTSPTPVIIEGLTEDEKKAIRYASGYIPRNLLPKLKRSVLSNKERLRMCLLEVIEEDAGVYDESQDWVKLVDRGGLMHINSKMFAFMTSMEMVVKTFLKQEDKPRDIKTELIKVIEGSDMIKIRWKELSAEWDGNDSVTLFTMIVNLWVTMRGFAYASGWMERWKQEAKKSVQKSQPLRKKLNKS